SGTARAGVRMDGNEQVRPVARGDCRGKEIDDVAGVFEQGCGWSGDLEIDRPFGMPAAAPAVGPEARLFIGRLGCLPVPRLQRDAYRTIRPSPALRLRHLDRRQAN